MDEVARAVQAVADDINNGRARPEGHMVTTNGSGADVGVDNMRKASELSAQMLRDAYEETARRAVDLAKANLERARADLEQAEAFANALRSHGDVLASAHEAGLGRAASVADVMASARGLIETGA